MYYLSFLPKFPLHLNNIILVSLALLLGLVGGEVARRLRYLPQITGYILMGFLIGHDGINIINPSVLTSSHVFIDISLSLILFELGRHLDFKWLSHDPSILYLSLVESTLTFISIFCILFFCAKMKLLSSAIAAVIALATSPAVVMMVANDLSSEGPVTRRALILTSLNNFYALVLFIVLASIAHPTAQFNTVTFAAYTLLGSLMLGLVVFFITAIIAALIGRNKENQFVLFVGAVLLAIGLAHVFNVSSMLTLFILGVAARNLDYKHLLMEINLNWLARLFFVLLFVNIGVHIKLQGLVEATWVVLAFVLVRLIAKLAGVWLVARRIRLSSQQSFSLGLSLYPMAGVALGMSNILVEFNPNFDEKLFLIITSAIAILNIIGPITTQLAFIMSGEALKE